MYTLLRILTVILAGLPYGAALAFGRALGRLGYLFVRRHRTVVLREMARCFPCETSIALRRRLRGVYEAMGMNYVEVFRWIGGRAEEMERRITVAGREHLDRAIAEGRGVLVLTAHTGNWDLMGLWGARNFPLTIISKDLRHSGVNRFWMEARQAAGLKIVPAHHSYRSCLATLRRGEVLGFILDQNMTRMEGIFVDFFGRPACTTPGLAFMAAHAKAPVVPVFMLREPDGRHRVWIQPPLAPPPDRTPAVVHAATQHYTSILEDVIRQHPDQWIWMHRRWRTIPLPGERTAGEGGPSEA